MLDIKSDGTGNWTEASVGVEDPNAMPENPFAGIADAASPGEIPAEFASAFSKYGEIEIEGITYHFREMTIEETLIDGGNPLMAMAQDRNQRDRDDDEFASEILNSEDVMIHMSKIILNRLIEMRVGDSVLEATPTLVWQLRKNVKLTLYNAILGLDTEEVSVVTRFPGDSSDGESGAS